MKNRNGSSFTLSSIVCDNVCSKMCIIANASRICVLLSRILNCKLFVFAFCMHLQIICIFKLHCLLYTLSWRCQEEIIDHLLLISILYINPNLFPDFSIFIFFFSNIKNTCISRCTVSSFHRIMIYHA